ncbi:50S ribosomal protein L9 [Clostridiaceae bacterium HSG29]|nr:50S ribosomal protein L9 [Clostridiaceae bacterium HSG29]
MKVILKKFVKGTGKAGEVVEVSEGFARNFLFSRNLAERATEGSINEQKHIAETNKKKNIENEKDALAKKERIESISVNIKTTAGENGRLFGSITKNDIVDRLKAEHKIAIKKKDIVMENNIKSLGETKVKVKLYKKINAILKVNVSKEK